MNINGAAPQGPHFVKKLEPTDDRGGGKDIKPVRTTLNRVPRSSEASLPLISSLTQTFLSSRSLREFSGTLPSLSPHPRHRMPVESKRCDVRALITPLVNAVGNNPSNVSSRNQTVKLL